MLHYNLTQQIPNSKVPPLNTISLPKSRMLLATIATLVSLVLLPASASAEAGEYRTIDWLDLLPKEDLDALLNPPEYINNVEEGSAADQISNQISNTIAAASDDAYQQALASTSIKPEMHDQAVRIPGFIVPLEFDDDQTITEFFLVPFFGACIHVPPPPPNQIIYAKYPEGLKLEALYDPFWITGTLKATLTQNDMATSAYAIDMSGYEAYTE